MNETQKKAIQWYASLSWINGIFEGSPREKDISISTDNLQHIQSTIECVKKFLLESIIKGDNDERIRPS